MKISRLFLPALALAAGLSPAHAASLSVRILGNGYGAHGGPLHPNDIQVGMTVTISLIVSGAPVAAPPQLPHVSGLAVSGSGLNPYAAHGVELNYFVTAAHPGELLIPAFDVHTADHQTLHVAPIALHVVK